MPSIRAMTRIAAALAVGASVLLQAAPGYANVVPPPGPGGPAPTAAQVVIGPQSADVGQTTRGFVGPAGFNPLAGYPPAVPNPPAGFVPADGGVDLFAGTIAATTQAGLILSFYCVDLSTDTSSGLGYDASTWTLSAITNIAYINRIINTFYPQTSLPAAATTNAQKAAAVQAAIWFFSDKFVLSTTGAVNAALYPIVQGIVTQTLAAGPLAVEPPLPQVIIDGPTTGTAGQVVGPFTVRATAVDVTVAITGGQMFADAAGTVPLASPATLPVGAQFFVSSPAPGSVVLNAEITSPVFAGSTALYRPVNPANPNPASAQKLILAQSVPVHA